jgi:hypothetical protein
MADQQINLVDHTNGSNTPETRTEASPPPPPPPKTPDAHIDVLYENQRGWFVFGIPLFSSKALWNFRVDPAPWVDSKFRPSAVNITNAQVPDPSWMWDWKSWYVAVQPAIQGLTMAWQSSLVPQLCEAEKMAAKTSQAKAATEDEGKRAREAVR